jgi:hypothetical protein
MVMAHFAAQLVTALCYWPEALGLLSLDRHAHIQRWLAGRRIGDLHLNGGDFHPVLSLRLLYDIL